MIAVVPAQSNGSDTKTRIEMLTEEVSPSRLKRWSTCRLQFYFHYVAQIPKSPTPALTVGKVVHSVLQEGNRRRWKSDFTFNDHLTEVFEAKWSEEQMGQEVDWKGKEQDEKAKTLSLLEFYLANTTIPRDEKAAAVEVHLEADLAKHGLPILIGIIDLVRPGGVIVDYKTSGQSPAEDRVGHLNEIQLTSYALLYRDATGKREAGLELTYLVKTKQPKVITASMPPATDAQQVRLFKQIESYVEGVQRRDFVPSPGMMQCAACQYFHECSRWS